MVTPPIERLREKYHDIQFDENRDSFRHQAMLNREHVVEDRDFPSVRCIDLALEFLDRNAAADGWLLQVETFDPHEPFHAPARFREAYPTAYHGPTLDWPRYREVLEQPEEIAELRANYAAVVALCDEQLGRLLDRFDEQDLWKSTALVLTTDHGFLLGEHDLWGKTRLPCYDEVAHIREHDLDLPRGADPGDDRRSAGDPGLVPGLRGGPESGGFLAMGGQIIDATIVAAPKQRNTEAEKAEIRAGRIPEAWADKPAKLAQKDRDARWTVKFSKARPSDHGSPRISPSTSTTNKFELAPVSAARLVVGWLST